MKLQKISFLEGKIDFRVCSDVVVGVLIWFWRESVITICWNEVVVVKDLIILCVCVRGALKNRWGQKGVKSGYKIKGLITWAGLARFVEIWAP